eukprot:scaffold319977_cov21-Tisochrysis_lutea.AAC.2
MQQYVVAPTDGSTQLLVHGDKRVTGQLQPRHLFSPMETGLIYYQPSSSATLPSEGAHKLSLLLLLYLARHL